MAWLIISHAYAAKETSNKETGSQDIQGAASGVDKKDEGLLVALQDCIKDFAKYLGESGVKHGDPIKSERLLNKLVRSVS